MKRLCCNEACTGTLCVRAVHALFVKRAKRNVSGTDTQCLTYAAPLRSLQQRLMKMLFRKRKDTPFFAFYHFFQTLKRFYKKNT